MPSWSSNGPRASGTTTCFSPVTRQERAINLDLASVDLQLLAAEPQLFDPGDAFRYVDAWISECNLPMFYGGLGHDVVQDRGDPNRVFQRI